MVSDRALSLCLTSSASFDTLAFISVTLPFSAVPTSIVRPWEMLSEACVKVINCACFADISLFKALSFTSSFSSLSMCGVLRSTGASVIAFWPSCTHVSIFFTSFSNSSQTATSFSSLVPHCTATSWTAAHREWTASTSSGALVRQAICWLSAATPWILPRYSSHCFSKTLVEPNRFCASCNDRGLEMPMLTLTSASSIHGLTSCSPDL